MWWSGFAMQFAWVSILRLTRGHSATFKPNGQAKIIFFMVRLLTIISSTFLLPHTPVSRAINAAKSLSERTVSEEGPVITKSPWRLSVLPELSTRCSRQIHRSSPDRYAWEGLIDETLCYGDKIKADKEWLHADVYLRKVHRPACFN